MANILSTEVVEFKAEGTDGVIGAAKKIGEETYKLIEDAKAMRAEWDKSFRKMRESTKLPPLRPALPKLPEQSFNPRSFAAGLASGADAFARKMRDTAKDSLLKFREIAKVAGPSLSAARGMMAGVPAIGGVAAGGGIAATWARGFSGTLESNRMDREFELLGREVAGAFRPVTDAFTEAIRGLRQNMEKWSPAKQDALATGGIVAAGGMGVAKATGGSFLGGALAFAGGAKGIDVLATMFNMAKFANTQVQSGTFGKDIGVSKEESDKFGYRKMTREKLDLESIRVKEAIEGHRSYLASFGGIKDMVIGSTFKAFGMDPFGTGKTSFNEYFKSGDQLYKRQQELKNIKNGAPTEKGEEANPNRRRVTPDNVSYGELGSSYEEAVIGLMKVNGGGGGETAEQKFSNAVDKWIDWMNKEQNGAGLIGLPLDQHPIANDTR